MCATAKHFPRDPSSWLWIDGTDECVRERKKKTSTTNALCECVTRCVNGKTSVTAEV